MTVERTEVRLEANTTRTDESLRRIDRELDALTTKANETVQRTRQARAQGQGVAGGIPIRTGAIKSKLGQSLTAGSIFQGGVNSIGISRSIGPFLAVHAAGQGLGAIQNVADRLGAMSERGATGDEMLRQTALSGTRSVVEMIGNITGVRTLAQNARRAFRGESEQEARESIERALERAFTTREELQRRRDAERAEREAREAEVDAKRDEALGKLRASLPSGVRLRTTSDIRRFRAALENQQRPDGLTNREAIDRSAKEAKEQAHRLATNEGR